MKVHQLLASKGDHVVVIAPTATVAELLDVLAEHNVGAVVVLGDGGDIEGIVSERDVVRALQRDHAAYEKPVREVMSASVRTCTIEHDMNALTVTMTEHRVRHLPVVNEQNRLIGIVSIGDVVKSRIGELEFEREQLANYLAQ